ncbi:P450-derived glycosyltransferase activator [Nocardiopsis gilva YIM 90087]|uniref:P450-derived glycosyltransferase activator n=1 Tax=Nocardiopsis gilva YIM 90087 TaxID=1235441 RepID=A0A223S167_9ACTN|nr:P450-derived glycosyltransferase activator [Nocardiopsis gilva]ASU81861.1 P450-derived glycosyltransferase activator [Nocardiopsis gilva YIM 90087]
MAKGRENTVIRQLLDHDVSDVTDSELGFHLGTTRALQWYFGSQGDAYAQVLRGQADDPHPLYAAVRERGPLHLSMVGSWVTADPAVAETVLSGDAFGVAAADGRGVEPQALPFFAAGLTGIEHSEADRLRELWEPLFGADAVKGHRSAVEETHRDLADRLTTAEGFDLVADFARPAAVAVTACVLGVADEDRGRFADLCARLAVLPDSLLAPQRLTTVRDLDSAATELRALLGGTSDDSPDMATVRALLAAEGVTATVNLIGNAVRALLDHPDQWKRLRDAPDLAESAVHETLRYDPPIQLEARVARTATEVGGQSVPAGAHVVVATAALGRDPALHAEPDRFDLTRAHASPAPHPSAFPGGGHREVAEPLSLLQAEVALRTLVEYLPRLRRTGPVVYRRRAPVTRGPLELPASAS